MFSSPPISMWALASVSLPDITVARSGRRTAVCQIERPDGRSRRMVLDRDGAQFCVLTDEAQDDLIQVRDYVLQTGGARVARYVVGAVVAGFRSVEDAAQVVDSTE